jgi:hypothetical protein
MTTKTSSRTSPRIRRVDRDGRLISSRNEVAWRVAPADRARVDPDAEYLFCAPDFLFPLADTSARALRLELDPTGR